VERKLKKVLDDMAEVCILVIIMNNTQKHSRGITHTFTVKQWSEMATVSEATRTAAKVKTDGVNRFVWVEGGKRVGARLVA